MLDSGLPVDGPISEQCSLDSMEYLQDRLIEGDECRYEQRSPTTVNTTMGAIMAFVRYCARHKWINAVPPVERLDVETRMKGRPVTAEEFELLLDATEGVVGKGVAESWRFTLKVLWQTAFRIGDVMDFSWDDLRVIHPLWPDATREFPTLAIPEKQKNGKFQEIPMLPGLRELLESVPKSNRNAWVVDPRPVEFQRDYKRTWVKPCETDLKLLVGKYSNSAIARACGVSEASVRKWCARLGLGSVSRSGNKPIAKPDVERIWANGRIEGAVVTQNHSERLTHERVGRIICQIGEKANIVVQQADDSGKRTKYASAHDIRRGCAQRLINEGVSAETLKLILRHSDFATTEKYYGAVRGAQAAAREIHGLRQNSVAVKNLSDLEITRIRKLLEQI